MLQNHFKYALRNIIRNRIYSVINIAGLSLSLVAVLLMALYIRDELSFDRFHANVDNIYRVVDDKETPGVTIRSAQSAAPVAPALKSEYPEVLEAVRLINTEALVKSGDRLFTERNIFYADESLFRVFSFNLQVGDADLALKDPSTVVMTRQMSEKYFGKEPPFGKTITMDGQTLKVSGVVENVPVNSHINFDFLVSMSTAQAKGSGYDWLFENWYSNNFHTYIKVTPGFDISRLAADMAAFDQRHQEAGGTTKHHYAFEKLAEIYLHSDREDQIGKTGNASNLFVFSAVAVFLLVIACINFINLSTARFATRAKEVGIKKVAGAGRGQLMRQFFTESFILTAISMLIAVVIAATTLPYFNQFTGKQVFINLSEPVQLVSLTLLLIFIGFLSGTYPAFVLSSYKPVASLKGKVSTSPWNINFRKGLVIFQFATSTVLIICTIIVYKQMQYMQHRELGFKAGQTMVINFEGDGNVRRRMGAIKSSIAAIPGIESVTASSNVPGDGKQGNWSMDFVKANGDTLRTELPIYLVDFDFLKQFKIPVVTGRGFSIDFTADTVESMLINETAVRKLGFARAEDALGVRVRMYPNDANIVGIIKDFHFEGLQKPVTPLAMRVRGANYRLLSLKMNTSDIKTTIAAVSGKWQQLVPERPLEFSFLNEAFTRQYEAETRFGKVFAFFAAIAILIACLGLFALALFSVQQRTKEIGIRKVLGAGIADITLKLGKQFIWLVFIGILIASPVAWFLMTGWLEKFAFRTEPGLIVFLSAGAAAMVISLLTISYHTISAAIASPAKSLRSE
ncbi:ABC transporter permease [Flavitalea antarctica]